MMDASPFLNPDPERVFYEDDLVLGIWDGFPLSPGHALLVPKRLVPTWFEATLEEQMALTAAIEKTKLTIEEKFGKADGYNIGINVGAAGGQTVFHLHVHVIPRHHGDVEDPRGGVRHVIPAKANYLKNPVVRESAGVGYGGNRLVSGEEDPLWGHLVRDLDRAQRADIAVAFVMRSGVKLILPQLVDLVEQRRGRLRLLTGDYLDVTDPDALQSLLDLPSERVEIRLFQSSLENLSFHPKCYIFHSERREVTAYVGSSNLSQSALREGVEWNYRVYSKDDPSGLTQVKESFEKLFWHPLTVALNQEVLDNYRKRRKRPDIIVGKTPAVAELEAKPEEPHPVQAQALKALQATREAGNQRALVVLATGLGKTWLSAFDTANFKRVLFVAHREEILDQARRTFRGVRPKSKLGLYTGKEKAPEADVLFASVQTLGRPEHFQNFGRDHFDYIVVDEFHHAAAASYRRFIDYFQPQFLLGLTATPERSDGGDLLGLCGENLVFRCGLGDGIKEGLLCPFRYLGVPDEVDFANIPWRSGRFQADALTKAVATQSRAANALEQHREHGGTRTVAFCCTQVHADFMAEYFRENGLRSVAVHSGAKSAPRASSLEALGEGKLDILCCVDMFNEGLDLPEIDTVMMLRPTESRIIFLQQLGRGLRRAEGKEKLTVIDYIGNHKSFLLKPQTLLLELTGEALKSNAEIARGLRELEEGEVELPEGCEVCYTLESIELLKSVMGRSSKKEALRHFYQDFKDKFGRRPSARELHHAGFNLRSLKKSFGSWLGFVKMMDDMEPDELAAFVANREFLESLEKTSMSKSYKPLVLLGMLAENALPGELSLPELAAAVRREAMKSQQLRADFSVGLEDEKALQRLLKDNPIKAWCGGKGMGGRSYFQFQNGVFKSHGIDRREGAAFAELVREILDWRLAEYLERGRRSQTNDSSFTVKVSRASGKPILMPLDRTAKPQIPKGEVKVRVAGESYLFRFVKIAVNVATRPGEKKNVLGDILRGLFGERAGEPGTNEFVVFRESEDGVWEMGCG